jgi:hypothetical protein
MDSNEHRFYRQLFLRRYALLLEKAEHTFRIPPETMGILRSHILSLDWVDTGVEKLEARVRPGLTHSHEFY